jgi:hydroxyethylthiazole kinase-like uncharacterized protein yjeF
MKILSKEQIYEGDRITIERQGISSTDLMERAGMQVFNWLHARLQGAQLPVHIFCGIGNNGGDGLVVARHLVVHGYNVKTYVVNCSDKRSKGFLHNYDRIKDVTKDWPELLNCTEDFPEIDHDDIIIDAIFGIGLNRLADDWVKALFQHFRQSKAFTLAIDIPSGLYLDRVPKDPNGVVWASCVLTFQSPKLVFFLPGTEQYVLEWDVLDIGFDEDYLATVPAQATLISRDEAIPMYKSRERFAHKGDFGHSLIIGGSYGKMGAVILASRAALSMGAGLVSTYIPKCGYTVLQTAFPEAMVLTDSNDEYITNIDFDMEPAAMAIGVGIGTHDETIAAFGRLLKKKNKLPLVIDADGLNILSKNKSLLELIPKKSILTPHPKELERLIGPWTDDFDKIEKTKQLSKTHDLVIIIKGANSMTVYKDHLYVNNSGNPGMATAGSGDVLTGIICGLVSQDYASLESAIFGVYLHGRSGDIAAMETGYEGLIASHIIEYLGDAVMDLFDQPEQLPEPDSQTDSTGDKEALT